MTILYVDDDLDDRQLFVESLRSIDEQSLCATARDGLEALNYLKTHELPDIIFMDINMPIMDGKTCLANIRKNTRTSRIPVIIFTTSNNPGERGECESLGASEFIKKPVSYSAMKDIMASIFKSKKFFFT
jgi:CheY-like chemotaxis protein